MGCLAEQLQQAGAGSANPQPSAAGLDEGEDDGGTDGCGSATNVPGGFPTSGAGVGSGGSGSGSGSSGGSSGSGSGGSSGSGSGGSGDDSGQGDSRNGPILSFGGSLYTENPASQFVIDGQTVTPGGQILVSGTSVSLAAGASFAVIAGSTQALAQANTVGEAFLTIGSNIYSAELGSVFTVDGQTLTPGGQITIAGTPVSFAPGGSVIIAAGSTQNVGAVATGLAPVIVFDGTTYTANSQSQLIIASQTLTPGGQIVVAGTPMSLDAGASIAVIGGSTQPVGRASAAPQPLITVPPLTPVRPSDSIPHPTSSSHNEEDGGDNYGITIAGYLTIASASQVPGYQPTAGPGAVNTLKGGARHSLGLFGSIITGLRGLRGSSRPSFNEIKSTFDQISSVEQDVASISKALKQLYLSKFSNDVKLQIQDIQIRSLSLLNSLGGVLNDLVQFRRTISDVLNEIDSTSFTQVLQDIENFNDEEDENDEDEDEDQTSSSTSSCSTSTVTDYFISCELITSDSSSCTMTSSSLVQGCDITASAVTTTSSAESCPLATPDADEDEGEDGNPNDILSNIRTVAGGPQQRATPTPNGNDAGQVLPTVASDLASVVAGAQPSQEPYSGDAGVGPPPPTENSDGGEGFSGVGVAANTMTAAP